MFKQRQTQSEQIPVGYQYLSEVCKPYKAGEKYLEFIQALQKKDFVIKNNMLLQELPGATWSPKGYHFL